MGKSKRLLLTVMAGEILLQLLLLMDSDGKPTVIVLGVCGIILVIVETVYLFKKIVREIDEVYLEENLKIASQQEKHREIRKADVQKKAEENRRIKSELLEMISRIESGVPDGNEGGQRLEEISEMTGKIEETLKKTREKIWCENTLVNMIMEEKEGIAKRYGIRLKAALYVPEDLPVNSLDLCSIFVNLLDNAIEAAGQMTENERKIEIKASIISGCLVLKTRNPFSESEAVTKRQKIFRKAQGEVHGVGLRILKETARKYGGNLIISEDGGIFSTVMWIDCRENRREG